MEIVIRSIQSEEYTIIEITDNGLGIDLEKYNDKIFMIYKRFHSHVEGKGLGLHLVKTQIMAMGGKIEVTSKPRVGTTFIIYFKK
jgi:signal transduction histidine kinase